MKMITLIVLVFVAITCVAYCDESLIIRKKPFNFHDDYEILNNGSSIGTIHKREFSLTPEYEIRNRYNEIGYIIREKPFSLYEEYEIKRSYWDYNPYKW